MEIVAIEYDDGTVMIIEKNKGNNHLHSYPYSDLYSFEQVLQDYVDGGAVIVDKKL